MIKNIISGKIVKVAENQRVLKFNDQKLEQILTPGTHRFRSFKNDLSFESYDLNKIFFDSENIERLFRNCDELRSHVEHIKLADEEIGLFFVNQQLKGVVAPGESVYYWKDSAEIDCIRLDISGQLAVEQKTQFLLHRSGANAASRLIKSRNTVAVQPMIEFYIDKNHIGLLYINGQLKGSLEPGVHAYWNFNQSIEVKTYDLRTQVLDISGQEILSKDRVSLRINLTATIQVMDAQLAARSVDSLDDYVYKTLQLALREAVGTKSLDDILLDKLYVNETVKELVSDTLQEIGVALKSVGVKDIILPGEMKAILNQVVEAQKAAEANVIKRREETSATRSLHNTAKVMENNPTLMRLKELEALEKIADRIENLTVYGGLEGLMNGVVKIA
ncbi:slipin family protein [Pleionea litopenaei]|uniref:Slipin family protein n=1 Tax=Pleionea litopenaei TaxID=3070815 RepID=A0AA51RWQ6_9GAMM|nr:slipin family protein [Pleionea sp. HL-JVS1]WMS88910.1 slipin family protein [Pleionea sp. HL-JVS1]